MRNLPKKLPEKSKNSLISKYKAKIKRLNAKIDIIKSKLKPTTIEVEAKLRVNEEKFSNNVKKLNLKIDEIQKAKKTSEIKINKKIDSKILSIKTKTLSKKELKSSLYESQRDNKLTEIEMSASNRILFVEKKIKALKIRNMKVVKQIKFKDAYLRAELEDKKILVDEYAKLIEKIKLNAYKDYWNRVRTNIKERKLNREQQQTNKNIMRPILVVANKMANQRHLMAVRNGVVMTMPLIVVGSLFLIITQFPITQDASASKQYLSDLMPLKWKDALSQIFKLFMGVIAIIVSFAVASSLGQSYGLDRTTSGVLGFVAFILWVIPSYMLKDGATSVQSTVNGSLHDVYLKSDLLMMGGLPLSQLGASGMFAAIVTSIVMVELYRLTQKYHVTIKLPQSVPQAVSNSFLILSPLLIYSVFVFFVGYIGDVNLITGLNKLFKPLENFLTSNIGGVMVLVLLITMFWSVGLHGVAIFNAVVRPIWTKAILANSAAYINGLDIPNKYPEPFLQWTVWIGGAGATLGLVIVTLMFARSKQLKAIGRASIIPGIFNINEPVIFGYPIMLNVVMIIPFILVPQVLVLTSWLFQTQIFEYSWVAVTPWTLPGPVGAFFAAGSTQGTQWGAILVSSINILISGIIYLPFLLSYDRQLVRQEKEKEKEELKLLNKHNVINRKVLTK